jgi:hypothetical protein
MSQLGTLIWLKWKLLRNSLRSSKAVVNRLASVFGMVVALAFSLVVAVSLGITAYVLTQPGALDEVLRRGSKSSEIPIAATTEFIFFSILGFLYLMWATVPLSIGGGKQFDAGKLLMYPITLRKLFAVDLLSEFTTLHSVFAVPAVLSIGIGAGLGSGNLAIALIGAVPAILFGVALSKWLSTTIGSLLQRKRARGETLVALIGAVAGLGGALAGQLVPLLFRHADSVRSLRWTPPGAAAVLLLAKPNESEYVIAFLTLSAYTVVLIVGTYLIARRAALGLGGGRRRKAVATNLNVPVYAGWQLPLVSSELSAVIEKELRYAFRNAQVRMMALMPLILIVVRFYNHSRMGDVRSSARAGEFMTYLSGLMASGGVLYVFLILGGLAANQFAFEEGGMRSYILAPVDRRKILIGKNIAVTIVALVFSAVLLVLNAVVFRDMSPGDLLFVLLSFVVFAAIMAIYGNWVSIRFPKRMRFGKRMNVSGVAGLLLIPMIVVLGAPPFLAAIAAYVSGSVYIGYATLALFAFISVMVYAIVINSQARDLARREIEILEAVREPSDE